ncbi:hypothetical protein ACFQS1_22355 [Paractinoplanes rhizophilus]|uniref:Uncharacterized protein n=1 Tax=Paractinoplanes rhizophilus TaxID=1416877 RepID=A0ABW2HU82_9ACTN
MSRQFRYRVTAFVLGGLIFGAPLLTNGTASAEQTGPAPEGGRQVTFEGGGMLDLACRSHPDIERMTVPADSTVRVINRTGYSARLQLSGDTKGTLPDDAATEVVFRRGTTSVLLRPNCPLGEDAVPVLVTAAPSASAQMPDPMPAPSDGGASASVTAATTSSGSPSGPASGSTLPDSAAASPSRLTPATGHSSVRAPATARTSAVAQAAAAAAQAMPQGGSSGRTKIKTSTGTAGSTAPAFAGMPPGDRKALLPGVPHLDLSPDTRQAAHAAPPAPPTEAAATQPAAEPVAAMEPVGETGPIGLLALTAAVCVMGVGAAAIRALVSQRANRAKVA